MEAVRTGIIYKYTSPDGKVYIGQTIAEAKRKASHKKKSITGASKFYSAIREHGYNNFKYEVVFTCKGTKEEIKPLLNSKEIEFIKLYDCAFNGLNSTKGNKQVDYYLDYNGRTKKELVEEAFKAYNFYNDRNAPNYIKDIYPHIYYKSKDEGCVCYFIYDEKTDSIRLKASLKNLVNNQPTWYDLKVA